MTRQFNFKLDDRDYSDLEKIAKKEKRTSSSLARIAIMEFIEKYNKKVKDDRSR